MKLDKVVVCYKVGDCETAPGKEYLGLKDGDPICYIDEKEFGKPLKEILGPNNYRVFSCVQHDRALLPKIKEWLKPIDANEDGLATDKLTYRPRSMRMDFDDLATRIDDKYLVEKLRSKTDVVPLINGLDISDTFLKDPSTIKNARSIIDINAWPAGNQNLSIGGGGADYGTIVLFQADQRNLSGDTVTGTKTGSTVEVTWAQFNISLGGGTFALASDTPHGGDPTVGWETQINHNSDMIWMSHEGPGTVDVGNLHTRRTVSTPNKRDFYIIGVAISSNMFFHDLLVDGNGANTYRGISIGDNTPLVYIYNSVVWDCNNANMILVSSNSNNIYENFSLYNATAWGFYFANLGGTCRNIAAYDNGGANDFGAQSNVLAFNNRSRDTSAANGNWAGGSSGNTTGATVLSDVQSVTDTDPTFFDIIPAGPLDGAGATNLIAARTTCIRGRPVPGPNGTSVGPAEAIAAGGMVFQLNPKSHGKGLLNAW